MNTLYINCAAGRGEGGEEVPGTLRAVTHSDARRRSVVTRVAQRPNVIIYSSDLSDKWVLKALLQIGTVSSRSYYTLQASKKMLTSKRSKSGWLSVMIVGIYGEWWLLG